MLSKILEFIGKEFIRKFYYIQLMKFSNTKKPF